MHPFGDDLVASFTLESLCGDVGHYLFLREHGRRRDVHLAQRDLKRAVSDDVLPPRARVVRTVDAGARRDVIAEVDDVLVLLRVWVADAEVWVSSRDAASARQVADEVWQRRPLVTDDRRVEVVFSDSETGSRTVALDLRPWGEVEHLYPAAVRTALAGLVQHRPQQDESRRLLLWHGPPGTGKTSAIRALLHGWRDWADAIVVSDPEHLLRDGKYLRRLLLDVDDEERWQLLVLEDAEALLQKNASSSAALGKLLNLADGLLGQGLRCLFLLTTNDPSTSLHPALLRPGRCLADVEFGPLSASEAATLLGRPVAGPLPLADVMAQRPVAVEQPAARVGQYL